MTHRFFPIDSRDHFQYLFRLPVEGSTGYVGQDVWLNTKMVYPRTVIHLTTNPGDHFEYSMLLPVEGWTGCASGCDGSKTSGKSQVPREGERSGSRDCSALDPVAYSAPPDPRSGRDVSSLPKNHSPVSNFAYLPSYTQRH